MSGKVGMSVIQTAFGCQSLDVYVGDFFTGFYLRGLKKTMKQPPFGQERGKLFWVSFSIRIQHTQIQDGLGFSFC